MPSDLLTAARFGVFGVFKLAQTCRELHVATARERHVFSGRMVVYKPPLSVAQAYIIKYVSKDRRSHVETMVYVHMLLHV